MGGGSPGGAGSPGGFAGKPGGAAGDAAADSGDITTAPSDTEAAKSCTADAASESMPPGVAGRDVSVVNGACSLCFSILTPTAECAAVVALAGVGGREEEDIEGALVDLRSRADAAVGAALVTAPELERCGRVVPAGRRLAWRAAGSVA